MTILDQQIKWREMGRIRMGDKGSKGQPQKLSAWRLTSASATLLAHAAELYGGTVQPWPDGPDEGLSQLYTDTNELDIMLPPIVNQHGEPGLAYSQFYEHWSGGGCQRRCDGVTELLSDKPCVCAASDGDRLCKVTTRAQVFLPRVPSVGVWRLDTHGMNAAMEIPGILNLLSAMSHNGSFVPAVLRLEQRSSKVDGKTQRFVVPVIDLPHTTLAQLTSGADVGLTASPPAVNAPVAIGRGKPPHGTVPELPADNGFESSPSFGPAPDLPSEGTRMKPARQPKVRDDAPPPSDADVPGAGDSSSQREAPAPGAVADAPDLVSEFEAEIARRDVVRPNFEAMLSKKYGTNDPSQMPADSLLAAIASLRRLKMRSAP